MVVSLEDCNKYPSTSLCCCLARGRKALCAGRSAPQWPPNTHSRGNPPRQSEQTERSSTNRPPYSGIEVRDFNCFLSFFLNFHEFSIKLSENNYFLYGNWAGIRADGVRIFLEIILVSKQPSKVRLWTSKLIFQFLDPSKIPVFLHNSIFGS